MLQVSQPLLEYNLDSLTLYYIGGVCVLPKSMREALRFFEMDAMLSLKERNVVFINHHPGVSQITP